MYFSFSFAAFVFALRYPLSYVRCASAAAVLFESRAQSTEDASCFLHAIQKSTASMPRYTHICIVYTHRQVASARNVSTPHVKACFVFARMSQDSTIYI